MEELDERLKYLDGLSLREIVMMAYLSHITGILGDVSKRRREELEGIFGISRLEIASDEDIENEKVTKELIKKLEDKKNSGSGIADQRGKKAVDKIKNLQAEGVEKPSAENSDSVKTAGMDGTGTGNAAPVPEDEMVEYLRNELSNARIREKEAEYKAERQRALYEESREKIRALEIIVADKAREHEELVALRELVYSLENEDERKDDAGDDSIDEMVALLNGYHGAVIGGHEAWSNRMKKKFPEWEFISVRESLSLDRVLSNVDVAFLFTDVMSHKMYYRMIGALRNHDIPFHFIHGTNAEKVIRAMHEAIEG